MVKFNLMNIPLQGKRAPAPPLGVVASLGAGFETVNSQWLLAGLPLILDLFLWLGPRLSILPLVQQAVAWLVVPADSPDAASLQPMWDSLRASLLDFGQGFNLFGLLSTSPLGVPSIMAGRLSTQTVLGEPVTWPVENWLSYGLFFGLFSLIGLLLGAAYFGGIAQQVRDQRLAWPALLRQVWGDWARLTALAVLLLLVLAVLGLPTLVAASLLTLIHPVLGNLASLLGASAILWVLAFGAFGPHGIVLRRRGLFGALWDSLRLVTRNLPATARLWATIVLINLGLGALWNLPEDNSWLRLVGLFGHAVVATALTAATFVFYQDRYRWWQETQPAPAGR